MNIWSSMLASAVNAKVIDTRTLLLLGGNAELQMNFVGQLVLSGQDTYTVKSSGSIAANAFGLGYLHLSVLERDQEDVILELDIYTLSRIYESYADIIISLIQRSNFKMEHMFVVTILDWEQPRGWIRSLAKCIRFLKFSVFENADQDIIDNSFTKCAERYQKLASTVFSESPNTATISNVAMPLKKGEYDAPLGVELLVAVMNSEKLEMLEKQLGRKDDEFDFIQQFLRTILLKHGASLVYLSSSSRTLFPLLFYALSPSISLSSQSVSTAIIEASKKIRPNVVDRDAILIPPGWDSWSKIELINEGFDVSGVSSGWASDVLDRDGDAEGFIEVYEESAHAFAGGTGGHDITIDVEPSLELLSTDDQKFLKHQLEEMNRKSAEAI
ncbi:dynein light intermediate chain-domain-containing protein [Lipomyces arxii]|uniref:dynein light intermediate chain-domain-containing protein n=1 Tax=Lipomyces arxii TaxID=56418 RepID=UPI0034CEBEF7